jgi:hypothetical protein
MTHGDAWEGKWRGNQWMEWVASTLHTTMEHGASSITTDDAHTSAASNRLNWRPHQFKWTHPFCWETKSGFCVCAITFQLASNKYVICFWIVGTNILIPECAHHTLFLLPLNIKTERQRCSYTIIINICYSSTKFCVIQILYSIISLW